MFVIFSVGFFVCLFFDSTGEWPFTMKTVEQTGVPEEKPQQLAPKVSDKRLKLTNLIGSNPHPLT